MIIAVLGANGYLGSYLIRHLIPNHTVIPVTRSTLDLTDYNQVNEWLNKTSPDVVINCAVSGGTLNINDVNYSDVQRDLTIFLNFYNNTAVKKYINIGSGAEFDRRIDIDRADEYSTLQSTPLESYGFTKNVIARMILKRSNFFTLRLFGCFDSSEPDVRLFRKFKQQGAITIQDKYFDFISAEDFAIIMEHYCISTNLFKDLNCVYERKLLLSEQLKMFAKQHVPNGLIDVKIARGLNYTGDGLKLARLKIPLKGLEQGIKDYE